MNIDTVKFRDMLTLMSDEELANFLAFVETDSVRKYAINSGKQVLERLTDEDDIDYTSQAQECIDNINSKIEQYRRDKFYYWLDIVEDAHRFIPRAIRILMYQHNDETSPDYKRFKIPYDLSNEYPDADITFEVQEKFVNYSI